MKLYGIRYAKGFKYGTQEAVFRTQKGNYEVIPDFSFFYYMAEYDGKYLLFDAGYRDEQLAAEKGVTLLETEGEIKHVFGSIPQICTIFLTHEVFIHKAYTHGWIPLPFHDKAILEKYDRLTENIVRII